MEKKIYTIDNLVDGFMFRYIHYGPNYFVTREHDAVIFTRDDDEPSDLTIDTVINSLNSGEYVELKYLTAKSTVRLIVPIDEEEAARAKDDFELFLLNANAHEVSFDMDSIIDIEFAEEGEALEAFGFNRDDIIAAAMELQEYDMSYSEASEVLNIMLAECDMQVGVSNDYMEQYVSNYMRDNNLIPEED
jgi:hypothetical protein